MARWRIEVFFKEIKQTLQLSDFMGYNENAVFELDEGYNPCDYIDDNAMEENGIEDVFE